MPTTPISRRGLDWRRAFLGWELVAHVAYGIFYTPVDMNTWCNQRHNVPLCLPADFAKRSIYPQHHTLELPAPVLGTTVVSFTALQLHAPAQYIQQWSASLEKQLGSADHCRGRIPGRGRIPSAALSPHQQCPARRQA